MEAGDDERGSKIPTRPNLKIRLCMPGGGEV